MVGRGDLCFQLAVARAGVEVQMGVEVLSWICKHCVCDHNVSTFHSIEIFPIVRALARVVSSAPIATKLSIPGKVLRAGVAFVDAVHFLDDSAGVTGYYYPPDIITPLYGGNNILGHYYPPYAGG